jgi:RNA polymerase sigma-70 factor (ECF subfamily)
MKADKSSLVGLWDIASVSEDEIIELIDATASRNRDAFGSLFRHFAPRIKAYGIKGGASIPLAEELAQETMISVWRGAHSFDRRRASGSSWIFTIARNRRIDLWRREARPEIKPEDLEVAGTEDTQPDSAQEACEVGRHLRAAVDTLSPDQSMVLRKAFFEDKSHGTISDELELPLGTVKSRIRLGLARLKVLMAEFES